MSESVAHHVVVGVDGAGRTHRLREIAAAAGDATWLDTSAGALPDRLAAARTAGSLIVVDDAHRLPADDLMLLAAAARRGTPLAVARRPTIDRPELAELDEQLAARGRIELLAPLDLDGVTALVHRVTGQRPAAETAAAVLRASAGLAAVAAAIAPAPDGPPPAALVARVQRRLAVQEPAVQALARVLALRLDLTDDVLAAAAGVPKDRLAAAMRSLRDNGLLEPDGERMIPAVAAAVLAELPPTGRRRVHDALAAALLAAGAGPVAAATQLRAARVWTPAAASVYRAAGDELRLSAPEAAVSWYDDAAQAGADPAALGAGRAEAAALLGLPVDTGVAVPASDSGRLVLVDGAVAAHQGRAGRAAETLLRAPDPGPLLAVPALVAVGRAADARAALADAAGPPSLARFAEAALAAADPRAALPLMIEAAEAVEAAPPPVVLPDTPHAVGAVLAVTAGDAASARYLLGRALEAGVGGPVAVDRHRLLLAWVRLRTGQYDTAVAEVGRLAGTPLPGRERLLVAALEAGIARRRGDVAGLRTAWSAVEPVLARGAVDLFCLEPVEELLVAAARVRQHRRLAPVLDRLEQIVGDLGRPAAWLTAVEWIRLQIAIVGGDADEAASVARRLDALAPADDRPRALHAAAGCWARVLAGEVDVEPVTAAITGLVEVDLPWEASRLAGQAAIRTTDAALARRLLERARELSHAGASHTTNDSPRAAAAGLSEREVAVARMVLAGDTYREIGARLFISPKTVEHHVARIRTKLGATSRAEFVAALRRALDEP